MRKNKWIFRANEEQWEGSGSFKNGYTWKLKKGYRGYDAPKDDKQIEDKIERLMTQLN